MATTILLADDHPVVRQGLRLLLEAEPDFSVVGETGDGLEVPGLVAELQPAVLVLDLMLPGLGGLEVTRRVRVRYGSSARLAWRRCCSSCSTGTSALINCWPAWAARMAVASSPAVAFLST